MCLVVLFSKYRQIANWKNILLSRLKKNTHALFFYSTASSKLHVTNSELVNQFVHMTEIFSFHTYTDLKLRYLNTNPKPTRSHQ